MDPRWVGAWWIPFLISGAIMFIITLPMLGYPKRLPGKLSGYTQRFLAARFDTIFFSELSTGRKGCRSLFDKSAEPYFLFYFSHPLVSFSGRKEFAPRRSMGTPHC